MSEIKQINAREVLDSRGNPTVAAQVITSSGANGSAMVPPRAAKVIRSVASILSIDWVNRGLEKEASIICPRSSDCPRDPCCVAKPKKHRPITEDIRDEIVQSVLTS